MRQQEPHDQRGRQGKQAHDVGAVGPEVGMNLNLFAEKGQGDSRKSGQCQAFQSASQE
jgi:hypothetical protein